MVVPMVLAMTASISLRRETTGCTRYHPVECDEVQSRNRCRRDEGGLCRKLFGTSSSSPGEMPTNTSAPSTTRHTISHSSMLKRLALLFTLTYSTPLITRRENQRP